MLAARGSWAQQSCEDCDQCMKDCVCQSDGTCEGTPKSNTAECNDGNPCTIGDHCDGAGSCVRGGNASNTTQCTYYLNPCAINVHCDGAGTCVAGGTKNVNESCTYEGLGLCGEGTCQDVGGGIIFCVPNNNCPVDFCHMCDPNNNGQCTLNRVLRSVQHGAVRLVRRMYSSERGRRVR